MIVPFAWILGVECAPENLLYAVRCRLGFGCLRCVYHVQAVVTIFLSLLSEASGRTKKLYLTTFLQFSENAYEFFKKIVYKISNTVKFLIVATSPIEAAHQTFKKLQFFYKKFPTLKTSN